MAAQAMRPRHAGHAGGAKWGGGWLQAPRLMGRLCENIDWPSLGKRRHNTGSCPPSTDTGGECALGRLSPAGRSGGSERGGTDVRRASRPDAAGRRRPTKEARPGACDHRLPHAICEGATNRRNAGGGTSTAMGARNAAEAPTPPMRRMPPTWRPTWRVGNMGARRKWVFRIVASPPMRAGHLANSGVSAASARQKCHGSDRPVDAASGTSAPEVAMSRCHPPVLPTCADVISVPVRRMARVSVSSSPTFLWENGECNRPTGQIRPRREIGRRRGTVASER
jgi:hypothetical protein